MVQRHGPIVFILSYCVPSVVVVVVSLLLLVLSEAGAACTHKVLFLSDVCVSVCVVERIYCTLYICISSSDSCVCVCACVCVKNVVAIAQGS